MSNHSETVAAFLESKDEGIRVHRIEGDALVFNGVEVAVVHSDKRSVYVYDKHAYDAGVEPDYIYPAVSDADAALFITNQFLHLDLPWDAFDH